MNKVLLVAVLSACGGHKQAQTGNTTPSVLGIQDSGDSTDHSGAMIPPEKMDEVQQDLKRKEMTISRCLAEAVEDRAVPKNTHGKVTVELVVSTGGQAQNVKVVRSDIESDQVLGCVKKHVEDISFPQLPKAFETSFTYAMETD